MIVIAQWIFRSKIIINFSVRNEVIKSMSFSFHFFCCFWFYLAIFVLKKLKAANETSHKLVFSLHSRIKRISLKFSIVMNIEYVFWVWTHLAITTFWNRTSSCWFNESFVKKYFTYEPRKKNTNTPDTVSAISLKHSIILLFLRYTSS